MSEAVVDTSASSLLQQRFESLTEVGEHGYSAALLTESQKEKCKKKQPSTCLLTFLSSLACFLWATVDLAGRGWLAPLMAPGLISLVLVLVGREKVALGAAGLECAEETESLLFM